MELRRGKNTNGIAVDITAKYSNKTVIRFFHITALSFNGIFLIFALFF